MNMELPPWQSDKAKATSDASIATSVASKSPAADAKTKSGSTRMSSADWRIFVRDAYATLFDVVGDWAYLYAIYHRDYDGDGVSLMNYALVVELGSFFSRDRVHGGRCRGRGRVHGGGGRG